MIDRVNRYYQLPASNELVSHMREGLTTHYAELFDELRQTSGDTQLHADNLNIPVKTLNYMAGEMGKHLMSELVRLAEIGLKTEEKTK